jgi:hypothetical protein
VEVGRLGDGPCSLIGYQAERGKLGWRDGSLDRPAPSASLGQRRGHGGQPMPGRRWPHLDHVPGGGKTRRGHPSNEGDEATPFWRSPARGSHWRRNRGVDGEASAAARRWQFGRVAAWSGRRRRPASRAWLGAAPALMVRDSSGAAACSSRGSGDGGGRAWRSLADVAGSDRRS